MPNPFPWDFLTQYPPRAWQVEAHDAAIDALRRGVRGVVVAATGAGKTAYTCGLVRTITKTLRKGNVVVVVVPSEALVGQTASALAGAMPKGQVGQWYGSKKERRTVIVACTKSMHTLADALVATGTKVGVLVVDEMHTDGGDRMAYFLENVPVWGKTGMSATPGGSNPDDPISGWDEVVYTYDIDTATRDGVLVPRRQYLWDGDDDAPVNEATESMIRRFANDWPGVVDAVDTEDAEWCAEHLCGAGIEALAFHSKLSKQEQKRRIRLLRERKIRCLVQIEMLTEGVDFPWLGWLVMRRKRASARAIVQYMGRALRTYPGKDEAVIMMLHPVSVTKALDLGRISFGDVDAASRAWEVTEREPSQPTEKIIPGAKRAPEMGRYAADLLAAAVSAGIVPSSTPRSNRWRSGPIGVAQYRRLCDLDADKMKSPVKRLPQEHRDTIRMAIAWEDTLTSGAADDLILVLEGIKAEVARRYRAGERKHWHWRGALPSVPVWRDDE